ncbi:MAG TPA: DUF3870 domain-containing protein [Thermoleophilia bacterium]|nr:DUF3870 domain-containing protein [Thermoleophilia bacterium]
MTEAIGGSIDGLPAGSPAAAGDRCIACGYAKLPRQTAAAQVYQMVTIVTLVDKPTNVVLEASVTLITPLARSFVETLLVGSNLEADQERILQELRVNYGGGAQKAVKQAYRDLCERYAEMKAAGGTYHR